MNWTFMSFLHIGLTELACFCKENLLESQFNNLWAELIAYFHFMRHRPQNKPKFGAWDTHTNKRSVGWQRQEDTENKAI
jgi:hypothetical protein